MNKIILWDFDGTLGYREGNWEEAFFELTENEIVKTKENFDIVSNMLQCGFPWHEPKKDFITINNSLDWWEYVKPRFIEIFTALGYDRHESVIKASKVPKQYASLDKWKLYNDVIPCLIQLQNHNWVSVLVTNNIPEFPTILNHLKLSTYFDDVFVSSLTGFNKPNPLILNGYLETLQKNSKIIVVGDRVESDLVFAKVIQADGILVRTKEKDQTLSFENLIDLTTYLLSLKIE
jgi:HAD superfamily hydrolase (TIGR01549 family)